LAVGLAFIAALLSAPSLFIGFHLDDYVHRYMLSELPGGAALRAAYGSPFGVANGQPATIHWQIEQGYAPFWTDPHLLLSLWRPISELTHKLDSLLWPNSALLMHAQSLSWFSLLVALVTLLYREVLGTTAVAGLAALFYAVDHTHGFAVGWIANRNALVASTFAVATLLCYHRTQRLGTRSAALLAPVLFLLSLLASEASCAVLAYVIGHALGFGAANLRKRLGTVLPLLLVFVAWRCAYSTLGYGARGSGLYIDPMQEPLRFAGAAMTRLPVLLLGALALPPAESVVFVPPALSQLIVFVGYLVAGAFGALVVRLSRERRSSRMWALGLLGSLLAICTTHPNNRLLFMADLGGMALLAQLSVGLIEDASWLPRARVPRAASRTFILLCCSLHLLLSPLLLPLTATSVAITSNVEREILAVDKSLDEQASEVVFVSSPDYFNVKLLPMLRALAGRPKLDRVRALSFGPVPLRILRQDPCTLLVDYVGGIMPTPLTELYRSSRRPMQRGTRIALHGLSIEVLDLTPDGRTARARFSFDQNLDDAEVRWFTWKGRGYVPFHPPAPGQSVELAAPQVSFEL
jgi:hypothetical protein